jgi:fused signal recognition particle receptor
MSEPRKPGLFGRLFGFGETPPPPAPETSPETTTPETTPKTPAAEAPAAGTPAPSTPAPGVPAPPAAAAEPVAAPEPPPSAEPVPPPVEAPAAPARPFFAAPAPPPAPAPEAPKESWIARLGKGLKRSSSAFGDKLGALFTKRKLDTATLDDLEDLLIESDLGVDTAAAIVARVSASRYEKGIGEDEVRAILAEEVAARLAPVAKPLVIDPARKPHVVLVVGVNGSGKTTTIGKVAARLRREGKSVMLAAGDTFRAAAIEQLKIWGERTGATVIARPQGSDASALVFDAFREATAAGVDVLLIDTAGRLQNRTELMAELEKVIRVIRKQDASAPHDVLLVLDATTGQNALQQVEIFGRMAGVTGLAMTKLDGTARGGILVAIATKHKIPVHFIGVGEGVDDLAPFDATDFARAIAGVEK